MKEKIKMTKKLIVSSKELTSFSQTLQTLSPNTQLVISVNNNALFSPQLVDVLKQLQTTMIGGVTLLFSDSSISPEAAEQLKNVIGPSCNYPLYFKPNSDTVGSQISEDLINLQQAIQGEVIRNIQLKNQQSSPETTFSTKTMNDVDATNPLAHKKIKLKALINEQMKRGSSRLAEQISPFLSVEVVHVEQLNQEVDVAAERVAVVESQVTAEESVQLQALQSYDRELIGYETFISPRYKKKMESATGDTQVLDGLCQMLRQELFANLPDAIKYLSPAAAETLAEHLPQLVTINKDNLPHGFMIKKTAIGELVLDYDPYIENEHANEYTPELEPSAGVVKPIYEVDLPDFLRTWLNDNASHWLSKNTDNRPLINLWIKYGDKGVKQFFTTLNEAVDEPELREFIVQAYLAHQPQWDHLANKAFFDSLRQIKQMYTYDKDKFAWLNLFLKDTGTSRHDLSKTIVAFNQFWTELKVMCQLANVPMEKLKAPEWSTPHGGNPVVYMERMLCILRNARNLGDQLDNLKSVAEGSVFKLPGIRLDNYGAYYAMKYEKYRTVSPLMLLTYRAEEQDARPFNPAFMLYQSSLESDFERALLIKKYHNDVLYGRTQSLWLVKKGANLKLSLEELRRLNLVIPFSKKTFTAAYQCYEKLPNEPFRLVFESERETAGEGIIIPSHATNDEIKAIMQQYEKQDPDHECEFGRDRIYKYLNAKVFRYLGQQTVGMTLGDFKAWVGERINPNYQASYSLLIALMFVSHHRYTGSSPKELNKNNVYDENLLFFIARLDNQQNEVLKHLLTLAQSSIYLNEHEAYRLIEIMSNLNSREFERSGFNKIDIIQSMFRWLRESPGASYALLSKLQSRDPMIFPTYNIADRLVELSHRQHFDITRSAIAGDILLFSLQLCSGHFYKSGNTSETIPNLLSKIDGPLMSHLKRLATGEESEMNDRLRWAFRLILASKESFTCEQFVGAFDELIKDPKGDVFVILQKYQFKVIQMTLPPMRYTENEALCMAQLLVKLKNLQLNAQQVREHPEIQRWIKSAESMSSLKLELEKEWARHGEALQKSDPTFLIYFFNELKNVRILSAFNNTTLPLGMRSVNRIIAQKIQSLSQFRNPVDLGSVDEISKQASAIANFVHKMLDNESIFSQSDELHKVIEPADLSQVSSEILLKFFELFSQMQRRNYLQLAKLCLEQIDWLKHREPAALFINQIKQLNDVAVPTYFLEQFVAKAVALPALDAARLETLKNHIVRLFTRDHQDKLLMLVMSEKMPLETIEAVLTYTENITRNRIPVAALFKMLFEQKRLDSFLSQLPGIPDTKRVTILEIMARAYAMSGRQTDFAQQNESTMVEQILKLSDKELGELSAIYQMTPLNLPALSKFLEHHQSSGQSIKEDYQLVEINPFGDRNIDQQFSCQDVERVINASKDLMNQHPYSYRYRKKLMEAFLFVNAIGHDLPVYDGKSARELTNEELKQRFLKLKKDPAHPARISDYKRRLLALGLMREAMYRSTGDFPYSTQMIAIIDGLLHEGDFISNIDTGQGKSMIDAMKASLLWLESDRVDVTTASLVDARRDVDHYGQYFNVLNIPFSQDPISASSSIDGFQKKGINYSTIAQLSLFFAKSKVLGQPFEDPDDHVSLVANESDFTLLDDRVTYRYAIDDGSGIPVGMEWIYDGINEFVSTWSLDDPSSSALQDVRDLKSYLLEKAKKLGRSSKIIEKFTDDQLITWLESSLMVKYSLKENHEYVIPDAVECVTIQGKPRDSKVTKVLMKDGKVSPDSVFGNGIQQLLYSRLNKLRKKDEFVISPQTKTIISSNNKNLIQYYRSKKGYIWGSTGTVGSIKEIEEQYRKYGLEFSKIEPHQKKQVEFQTPLFLDNETQQFDQIITELMGYIKSGAQSPHLIFCKDIDTATRLFNALKSKEEDTNELGCQLYTGVNEKEEEVIERARQPKMITITTAAYSGPQN